MDDVDCFDGYGFEVFCSLLWSKRGFITKLTPQTGDGGIDVIALNGREGEFLQCKSSINRELGWDAVKEVTAGAARYQMQFSGTRFKKIAVTNQEFTSGAIKQAEANHVHLVTREQLSQLLIENPITNYEFDEGLNA